MKKLIVFILLISLLLSGCINQNEEKIKEKSEKKVENETVEPKEEEKKVEKNETNNTVLIDQTLYVYFINLESEEAHPEATLVIKNNKTMLIDTGSPDTYAQLKEYLNSKNIKTLDVLLVTRANGNYSGGFEQVVSDFKVISLWRPYGESVENPQFSKILKNYSETIETRFLDEKEYEIIEGRIIGSQGVIREGFNLSVYSSGEFEEVGIEVIRNGGLDIQANTAPTYKISYKDVCFVLPTNSNAGAQRELINSYKKVIDCPIIVAPDHGLGRSNRDARLFFDTTKPEFVILTGRDEEERTAGRNALKNALNDLRIEYTELYTKGTVLVKTDGIEYEILYE